MIHPWILFLSVVAAVVSALIATLASRRCGMLCEEVRGTAAALRSARSKIAELDSDYDALNSAFITLRGKFYAERRKSQQDSSNSDGQQDHTSGSTATDAVNRLTWKAQMRDKYGINRPR